MSPIRLSTLTLPISRLPLQALLRPRAATFSRASQLLQQSSCIQISRVSTAPVPPRKRFASFLWRIFRFATRAVVYTSLGAVLIIIYDWPRLSAAIHIIRNPPTAAQTLKMYVPVDDESRAVEDYINSHPFVAELRSRTELTESRPHLRIPEAYRAQSLTGGVLMGTGKVTVPPFDWTEEEGKSYFQIAHLGPDLCGYPGIVHGGFLATMLDEGLARCCFAALPSRIGMTANLTINYRSPAKADSYVVLKATTTKVEGRKAWVEGRIETLVGEGETPVVIADATALFIEPKKAKVLKNLMPTDTT